MFKSNGLILYKLEKDDLPDLWNLKQESWDTTHNVTIVNQEDQHRWYSSLDQHVHSPLNLVLIAKLQDDTKIGIFKITNIDYISHISNVAWDVFEKYRRKGYGKKLVEAGSEFCFSILNLRRLTAEILSINYPSKKCAQAARYTHEGTKRQLVHKNGKFFDSEIWGVLKDEFRVSI